ncbi:MAG: response regulator transcription factor [Ectothiorhodospiraceae bacterium]|nr:response regulator transcription factor [Ectothiorhodospiraceae bacterium]MCH8503657.1 response regulator transcription factor [Ectothiorhodospiraceae bacterium]
MIRVFLADDHTIVRDGLKQILSGEPDMDVVGESWDGQSTMERLQREGCDVLVLDICMPRPNGVDLIRQLRQECPGVAVLVLSMHPERQYAVRCIRAGARGYLAKTIAAEQLVLAIRKVAVGEVFLNAEVTQELALNMLTEEQQEPHTLLSRREMDVFTRLVGGLTVGQIADQLELSVKTVSTHKARIMQKMQMSSVAALVYYAMEHGLLPEREGE